MVDLKAEFISCAHCQGSGTCKNGEDDSSCFVCLKARKLTTNDKQTGLVCSVCKGLGVVEPLTARLRNRIVPVLALLIVYVAMYMLMHFANTDHFNEVLAFVATLIGSVTGYYFGGKSKS
jgi:hypothetical protein